MGTRKGSRQPADIVRLLLLAGCRRDEIVGLRRSEVRDGMPALVDSWIGPGTVRLNSRARRIPDRSLRRECKSLSGYHRLIVSFTKANGTGGIQGGQALQRLVVDGEDALKNRMKIGIAAVVSLLVLSAPAHSNDSHGAIAFSRDDANGTVAFGFAWNYTTRRAAHEAALSACRSAGGAACTELARFQNACGALALDRHGRAQGRGGSSREHAEARAVQSCTLSGGSGCAVVGSQCTGEGGETGTWSGSENILAAPETPLRQPPSAPAEALSYEQRIRAQRSLLALGFDAGPADGVFGPRTRAAIREWQTVNGRKATGYLSRDEVEALAAAPKPVEPKNRILYFAAAGPQCGEMDEGASCWRELSNKPGCYAWVGYYSPEASADWTGECSGDTAHGPGRYSVQGQGSVLPSSGTGTFLYGRKNGRWDIRWEDGSTFKGEFRDGMANGFGVAVLADGRTYEGQWTGGCFRSPDGKKAHLDTTEEACGF